MTPAVQSMVAATYVRNIDASRAFYELLGFHEHSAGRAATSAWSSLHQGDHMVLLASTQPSLDLPKLPLLFYFYLDDLGAAVAGLAAAGVDAVHMGCPPHAMGGEVKLADPDGNTVLIGQLERSAAQAQSPAREGPPHFSLLKEAAALVAARGGAATGCEVNNADHTPCAASAEVKLADAAGGAAWACLDHAHEILLSVPGAFIANHGDQADQGITEYLTRRRG